MLRKMLDGFFAQTCLDHVEHEIIVVDNNSSDETAQVVKALKNRPTLRYVFEARQGLCAARNRGIAETGGDVVAFLDDDVIVDPQWLEHLERSFAETSAAVVGGGSYLIFEGKRPDWLGPGLHNMLAEVNLGTIRRVVPGGKGLFGLNLAFRRSALQRAGGFDENLDRRGKGLLGGGDTAALRSIARAGLTIVYDPDAVVGHMIPPDRMQWEHIKKQAHAMGISLAAAAEPGSFIVRLARLLRSTLAVIVIALAFAVWRVFRGDAHESRAAMRKAITMSACLVGHWRALLRPRKAQLTHPRI